VSVKRILPILTVLALLPLLLTCRLESALGPASSGAGLLPADRILDVARSYSGPFEYATLLPVEVNLTVELYRQPTAAAALERLSNSGELIIVTLENSKGEQLYAGSVPSGGTLSTVLVLPAAAEDVVLSLEAPGFEARQVTIDGMVLYSEVSRVMGLLSKGVSAKGEALLDSDHDGVPDIYDVDPLDPEVAFKVRTPASGYFTVAFEDLYPTPGDADYNDFVANYFVLENHKAEVIKEPTEMVEEVEKDEIKVGLGSLHGEAKATAKIAGYNHKFGIVVDFPEVTASKVTRVYYDALGVQQTDTQENVADKAVIWLFENTKWAVDKTATFDITFPKGMARSMLSISPHDPVLYVLNTGKDIHLVGKDSLSGPVSRRTYMDPNGYPWALLVPEDWKHPAETQYIGKAYPLFDDWRMSEGTKAPYWYLYPASTGSVSGNNPPYPVTGPTVNPQLIANSTAVQEFDLSFKSADGSGDPDGGSVQFMHSPVPLALKELFSLDAATGLVTFKAGVPMGEYLFYFWSVDVWGASTIASPFKVTFTFHSKPTTGYPRVVIDTFSPNGDFTADTHIDLFGTAGDTDGGDPWLDTDAGQVLAAADDGGSFPLMARLDYTGGLSPGTYFIRVRGNVEAFDEFYAIRVLMPAPGATVPAHDYAAFPLALAGKPDSFESDDDPANDFAMLNPVPIKPGDANALSRSLDLRSYVSDTEYTGDVDWFELVLP
jgi:LruC domain-containing protein